MGAPELVLVGGGHAHVQVLRSLAMSARTAARLTVVLDRAVAVYSGMVPGYVAGQYRRDELEIDVLPLARRAGARVILAPALAVDAGRRRIEVEGRPPVAFDVASLDVGSTVAGLETSGVREHAIPTRPIGRFVRRVDAAVAQLAAIGQARIVIVGGGAAGVELAFTLEQRVRAAGARPDVQVVFAGDRLLADLPDRLASRIERRMHERAIRIRRRATVREVGAKGVVLDDGDELAADAVVWATGAAPHPWLEASGLPADERGFVRVRSTLEVDGVEGLFAVGDCASPVERPDLPKAGVYAVRQGPILIANLRARLAGRALRRYRPQADFLALLNLGDGTAVGSKWGQVMEGPWVMRLKDRIDRRFLRRLQVLTADGLPSPGFDEAVMAAGSNMECGGCAAKVGADLLGRALAQVGARADDSVALGLEAADDAAAFRSPGGGLVVATIDGFRPFADDPWLVGRVAAVNAASDLHAKGVAPRHALALIALPGDASDARTEDLLAEILTGARAAFDPLGVTIVGGHTTRSRELLIGFTVTGFASDRDLLANDRARTDQRLILTKPLGTGVVLHADMIGRAPARWLEPTIAHMLRTNAAAMEVAVTSGASAATDVTGFGLAGHLAAMMRRSDASARIDLSELPALPGAVELLAQGLRSTGHAQNERVRPALAIAGNAASSSVLPLLFDPQTSGGLLIAMPPEAVGDAIGRLREAGDHHAVEIGLVIPPRPDGAAIEVVAG